MPPLTRRSVEARVGEAESEFDKHGGPWAVRRELIVPAGDARRRMKPIEGTTAAPRAGTDRVVEEPRRAAGRLVGELADLDETLLERAAAWRELAVQLDRLRRELALARFRERSPQAATGRAPRLGTPPSSVADSDPMMLHFETALRETEERRTALHAELVQLRRRREDVLQGLPMFAVRAYQSSTDAGRLPVVVPVRDGACSGCGCGVSESLVAALAAGAVVDCPECRRLLRHSEADR